MTESERNNKNRLAAFIKYYLEETKSTRRTSDSLSGQQLQNPDSLSEQRLHKLIYLTELLLINETQHQPLEIDFRPFIDGIFSEEVHTLISEFVLVNKRPINVEGKNITRCTIKDEDDRPNNRREFELEKQDKDIAETVFENCKELNTSEITDTVRATPPFSGTKYGVNMDLQTLYE